MSKLTDLLEGSERRSPAPLGFSAATGGAQGPPAIVLIAKINREDLTDTSAIEDVLADAYLLDLDEPDDETLDSMAEVAGERPWGVRGSDLDSSLVDSLTEKGCDYVVIDPERTSAGVLSAEDVGKVISLGPDLDEDMGRALRDLPLDAAILELAEGLFPLTVQRLMDLQLLRGRFSGLAIVPAPLSLESEDLDALRNIGVSGLLIESSSSKEVSDLKDRIASLPRHQAREERWTPLVPGGGPSPSTEYEDD